MSEVMLTILVPIYNVEKYLEECLDSVTNQSYKDLEIICINDGSTDGSGDILKKYQSKDKRIIVIEKANTGYGNSMNIGISKAKGKYIGIVESDDFIERNMYETLINKAIETDAEIIRANLWKHTASDGDGFYELQDNIIYNTLFSTENIPRILLSPPFVWTGIYNREYLTSNNIWFNETQGASFQDVGFMFKALAMAKRVLFLRDAFYHYRCDNELASTKSPEKKRCVYHEFESINCYFEQHCSFENLKYYIPMAHFRRGYESFLRTRLEDRITEVGVLLESMRFYQEKGLINRALWTEEDYQKYSGIEIEAIRYYWRYQFANSLCNQGDLYIYGVGIVAQEFYSYLKACRVGVKAFLVTDISGKPKEINGVPVIEFNREILDPNECCIFVATKIRYQRSIYLKLKEGGYKKVYLMTYELGDELGIDFRTIANK